MKIDEFVIDVTSFQNYLNTGFYNDLLLLACQDLQAKIKRRVTENNVLGSGQSYDYSNKTTLVGRKSFLENKKGVFDNILAMAKNKKNEEIHWVTLKNGRRLIVLPGGYAEIRKLEGNLNDKKNYQRSGEMWLGFGIKESDSKSVTIGGTTEMSQNKINWNSKRDNDNIIAPNETEIQELNDFIANKIAQKLNDTLNR